MNIEDLTPEQIAELLERQRATEAVEVVDVVEVVEPPTMTDALQDEANETTEVQRPEGAPDLWPFHQLPRRKRALMLRRLAALQERAESMNLDDLPEEGDEVTGQTILQAADAFDLAADAEEFLSAACLPGEQETFEAWCRTADDQAVLDLMSWYTARFDVGEALPSSS